MAWNGSTRRHNSPRSEPDQLSPTKRTRSIMAETKYSNFSIVCGKRIVPDSVSKMRPPKFAKPEPEKYVSPTLPIPIETRTGRILTTAKSQARAPEPSRGELMSQNDVRKARRVITRLEQKRQAALMIRKTPDWAGGGVSAQGPSSVEYSRKKVYSKWTEITDQCVITM